MHSKKPLKEFAKSSRHDISAEWYGRWPTVANTPAHEPVSIARSVSELEEIGALRYELYIERDHKLYAAVDHSCRTFVEPIDQVSLNFQAKMDGRVLAAVRLVRAEDALRDKHLSLLVEAYQPHEIDTTVVCSRFVARSEHRARALIKPMFQQVYHIGMQAGARNCIIGTRTELIGVFERFGFRRTSGQVRDPVASDIHVLDLESHDLPHLRQIQSPLVQIAEAFLGTSSDTQLKEVV